MLSQCTVSPDLRSITMMPQRAGSPAEAKAALAQFLDLAEREMAPFPGRDLTGWRPCLHGYIEYCDAADFEHLCAALRAAGLR
jgi:hypothetical protein